MAVIKGWKFPVQVDETTGKIKTVEDNENIKQSVRMILETQKNERKVVPEFGTDLQSFMFDVVDATFVSNLKKSVEGSIKMWEGHIEDINVAINASSGAVATVEAAVDYITDIEPTQERVLKKVNDQ